MSEGQTVLPSLEEYQGTFRDGCVYLDAPVNWPGGTRVLVRVAPPATSANVEPFGPVIIAGFGLPGRWVADIFDRHGIEYRVVDSNPETVRVQQSLGRTVIQGDISEEETLVRAGVAQASILALTVPNEQAVLGRTVIQGDISEEETLVRAGVAQASILALTVPNEQAVLKATELARKLNPGIYIVARTTHSSAGMEASRLGADEVVKAEQAVARQFYEMLLRKLNAQSNGG